MEFTTKQAADVLGVDRTTIYNRIRAGELAARTVPGPGRNGYKYVVEMPDAEVPAGQPAQTQAPANFVNLRQATRLTGIRYSRLVYNCEQSTYPSATKVMIGRQARWYVSRQDLGLTAQADQPIGITAEIGRQFTELAQQLFDAGKTEGFDECKAAILGRLTNGRAS